MTAAGKGKRKVTVKMLDSESHRFEPGSAPVHLIKGQVLDIEADLAARWIEIKLAKKFKKPTKKGTANDGQTKGGGE